MFKIFGKAYPLPTVRERFAHAVVISIFVYFFLRFLEPFDLNLLHSENKEWIVLGYGVNIFILLIVIYVSIPPAFPGLFSDIKWRVYNEIIWIGTVLFIIGISLSIYEEIIDTRPLTLLSISETIGKTIIIGIFPLTGIILLNQIRLLKKHLGEARTINPSLNRNPDGNTESVANLVTIESDNKSEYFQKNVISILFLSALGNYVEIYTDENGKVERTILRTTLAKVEEQLSEYAQLFRCHRAFMVNIQNITSINGNAGGYTLYFKNTGKIVFVSRRNTVKFKSMIRGI